MDFKRLKYTFIIGFLMVLTSCGASFGERYTQGNLEIYYTKEIQPARVKRLANYFSENGLIAAEKHSVQITSDDQSFILKMVLNPDYKTLPQGQKHHLNLLEEELKNVVFDGHHFKIQVCNENFYPVQSK